MPICPVCDKEITSLSYSEDMSESGTIYLEGEHLRIEAASSDRLPDTFRYSCPECAAELGTRREEAKRFLREGSNRNIEDNIFHCPKHNQGFSSTCPLCDKERKSESILKSTGWEVKESGELEGWNVQS